MRILQVITDNTRRGAQTFALDLHEAMEREPEVDVETVALASETTDGLSVATLGPSRRSPRTLYALRSAAKPADIVLAHGSTTLTMSVLATAGTRTPVIYRQISESVFWAPGWRRRHRVAALLRRTDRVVALAEQSKRVLVEYFGLCPDHIVVIPNGVPAERYPAPTAEQRAAARRALQVTDRYSVAYIGALVPEKGVDVAIDAVAGLAGATLLIAGDGPERVALTEHVRTVGADARFLGSVERPLEVLHAADVLVLPSKGGDSMPAVLIEGAFTGLPVIATSVGAIGDIVEDHRTGLLLERADPAMLTTAMERLRDAPEEARALGMAARVRAITRFEIAVLARSWLATCADVLEEDDAI